MEFVRTPHEINAWVKTITNIVCWHTQHNDIQEIETV